MPQSKLAKTILDRLVTAENKLRSNPKQGIEFLLAQRPLLEQQTVEAEGLDAHANWGHFFRELFRHAGHLPSPALALDLAREAIERFRLDKATLEHNDTVVVRLALRKARAMLAEAALDAGRIDEAMAQIDAGFEIKSSHGEYEDPFAPHVVLRARILLAACGADAAARPRFFDTLLQVEKKAPKEYETQLALDAAPADFRAWLADPAYAAYKRGHAVEKLRRGRKGEKWPAAVERVGRAIAALWPDTAQEDEVGDDGDDGWPEQVIRCAPEAEATLAAFEAQLGCAIPPDLRTLYLQHGAFALRDPERWRSLRLPDSRAGLPMLAGLVDAIDALWGGRPEFAHSFDAAQIARLNREFIAFGHFFHDDNAYTHLYFTRAGGYGVLYYDQDDWDSAHAVFKRMLVDPDQDTTTLDILVGAQADNVIDALIAARDEADSSA